MRQRSSLLLLLLLCDGLYVALRPCSIERGHGDGSVVLSFSDAREKSMVPAVSLDIATYDITFSHAGQSTVSLSGVSGTATQTQPVSLKPGSWTEIPDPPVHRDRGTRRHRRGRQRPERGFADTLLIASGACTVDCLCCSPRNGSVVVELSNHVTRAIPIDLSGLQHTLKAGASMTVTANTAVSVDSYQWYLDGQPVDGGKARKVTIGGALSAGDYALTVVVRKGSVYSSKSASFTVIAKLTPASPQRRRREQSSFSPCIVAQSRVQPDSNGRPTVWGIVMTCAAIQMQLAVGEIEAAITDITAAAISIAVSAIRTGPEQETTAASAQR